MSPETFLGRSVSGAPVAATAAGAYFQIPLSLAMLSLRANGRTRTEIAQVGNLHYLAILQ
jgi:hypothetical protein